MTYCVYVDWTQEDVPRPFYVGKGRTKRLHSFTRNRKHTNVRNKHGLHREVVLTTDDEQEAFELERQLIIEHNTYASELGCNFTMGGEGVSGLKHTEAAKQRMSESHKGMRNSDAARRKMSEHWKGRSFSEETRKRLSESNRDTNRGRKLTIEHRSKIAAAIKEWHTRKREEAK